MTKEIVPAENFQLMQMEDVNEITESISENLGDETLSVNDLERIKVPSGGGTTWEIPTIDGEEKVDELAGIVVHWKNVRAYWSEDFDGSNQPPDCYSDDASVGIGEPGGDCNSCDMAKFGSDRNGVGQACKAMRLLFILRENELLPKVIPAPPTSLKPVKKYFLQLASKGLPYWSVVSVFTLEKNKNNNGIEYAAIKPKMNERLSDEARQKIKQYTEAIKPALESVQVQAGDYDTVQEATEEADIEVEE